MILTPSIQGQMTACDMTLSWRADELSAEYKVEKHQQLNLSQQISTTSGWIAVTYDAMMAVVTLFINGEAPLGMAELYALAEPVMPANEDLRCIP